MEHEFFHLVEQNENGKHQRKGKQWHAFAKLWLRISFGSTLTPLTSIFKSSFNIYMQHSPACKCENIPAALRSAVILVFSKGN